MDKWGKNVSGRRRLVALLAVLVIFALVGAACDDDDDTGSNGAAGADVEITSPEDAVNVRQQVVEAVEPVESLSLEPEKAQLPDPEETPAPVETPAPEETAAADPTAGFLGGILNNPVGTLEIVNVEVDQVGLQVGATEALSIDYLDPASENESWVWHVLGLYSSPEVAQEHYNNLVAAYTGDGQLVVETIAITVDGQDVGTGVVLQEGEPTGAPGEANFSVLWTNGSIFAEAYGSVSIDFFNQLTY